MCDPRLESWTWGREEKNKGHYLDSCLHLSMYCGLDDNILSMLNILVLINVLRLYKRMFLETELLRSKKSTMSPTNSQMVLKIYVFTYAHIYREKEDDTANKAIRKWVMILSKGYIGVPCTILFLHQKLGGTHTIPYSQ